jgi:hypothetical protein
MGVGVPKSTLLYELLIKDGLKLSGAIPLSSEELAQQLMEVLNQSDSC